MHRLSGDKEYFWYRNAWWLQYFVLCIHFCFKVALSVTLIVNVCFRSFLRCVQSQHYIFHLGKEWFNNGNDGLVLFRSVITNSMIFLYWASINIVFSSKNVCSEIQLASAPVYVHKLSKVFVTWVPVAAQAGGLLPVVCLKYYKEGLEM